MTAVVVPEVGCEVSRQGWIDHAKGRIVPSEVPETVTALDEIPRNQSGTLLEGALRA
ncbi:hypothetical protein MTX35_06680 [Rhodococcus sp. ARC_M12]|uniref:hypothetical protein n=1 Tax=unclassified Rhodococcus (in: high G+C Gram-positive bacteria) TaxID=192944 RepID=UPI001FB21ABD|nr:MULTISPECIES: hypothetical protein [unclassified Rhodococcus (in: high G+C Gram-positive bacteria)]MCJ0894644.1 hypothetical protein [Rhodococcus sp. ARC_M5]MCJ0977380.1 hypothetical protein [Rhodococcus sp. ARC_M12]